MIGRLPRNLDRPLLGTCENAKAHLAPPGGFTVTVPFTLFFVPCWANFFFLCHPSTVPNFAVLRFCVGLSVLPINPTISSDPLRLGWPDELPKVRFRYLVPSGTLHCCPKTVCCRALLPAHSVPFLVGTNAKITSAPKQTKMHEAKHYSSGTKGHAYMKQNHPHYLRDSCKKNKGTRKVGIMQNSSGMYRGN